MGLKIKNKPKKGQLVFYHHYKGKPMILAKIANVKNHKITLERTASWYQLGLREFRFNGKITGSYREEFKRLGIPKSRWCYITFPKSYKIKLWTLRFQRSKRN